MKYGEVLGRFLAVQVKYCIFEFGKVIFIINNNKYLIIKILMILGEQAESRWISLRNTFTKKLREMKSEPSGSRLKMTWTYFKQMSFFIPHIAHRM